MGSVGNSSALTKTNVTLYGHGVDLPDKLVYSRDRLMEASNRLKDFEQQRVNNKIEFGLTLRDDGWARREYRGGRSGVKISGLDLKQSEGYSHNHPRKEDTGSLGGTLSPEDLDVFARYSNLKYFRAVAQEGVYTIMRKQGFDSKAKDFIKEYSDYSKAEYNKQSDAERVLYKDYLAHKITYKQYVQKVNTDGNKMLINLHNWLLKNRKKYSYDYALTEEY